MRLNRKGRINADLQVITIGCSDDLCSPSWAAREYLINHGLISDIPESNIHPVRNAGGVLTGEVLGKNETEIAIVNEHLMRELGFLLEKKGATFIFATGHNPCAGCNSINVCVEKHKQRLVKFATDVIKRYGTEFDFKVVVMFEEHDHGDHYDVIEVFCSAGTAVAA